MGCCQQLPLKENESYTVEQITLQENCFPKDLQMQSLALNLVKGDMDDIDSFEIKRLGNTCVNNILNEQQSIKMENQNNAQFKDKNIIILLIFIQNAVFICNILSTLNKPQFVRDSGSKNLNKKFIGML
ncbi:unnamed protein product [Paramecium sonneborni]|uniref:Transmembrane protein n=1 Tax=Paramecium sonneborni TaxID=65129 RepID=A0A8S1PG42_9CILI|nr:unnamed protein product [Paramecium sonneborni]